MSEYLLPQVASDVAKAIDNALAGVTHSKQTLTEDQKAQARENIGALSEADKTELQEQAGELSNATVKKVMGDNLIDPSASENGVIISKSNGTLETNASYNTTDYIPIKAGQSIIFGFNVRRFLAYNANKTPITSTYQSNENFAGYVYTASVDGYVRASYSVSYSPTITNATGGFLMALYGTELPEKPIPFRHQAEEGVYLSKAMEGQVIGLLGNALYGKKWYACGDSFTEGDFTGLTDGYKFTDEPYYNKNKVYPYFIGRRCGVNVVNLGKCGMTMTEIDGRTNDFCTEKYQEIGEDADYITLKFGINDGNYNAPVGTIDDTVTTTFYGAWNAVLTWLITNRPNAKIGIIVTNGLSGNTLADATIAIAKKYGIPYLNEWNGEQVPTLIRSGRAELDPAIKNLIDEKFRVTETNKHPNVACHEYESTIVEAWLKTL